MNTFVYIAVGYKDDIIPYFCNSMVQFGAQINKH